MFKTLIFIMGGVFLCNLAIAAPIQPQKDEVTLKLERWAESNPDDFNAFVKRCSEDREYMLKNMKVCNTAIAHKAGEISDAYRLQQ